VHCGEPRNGKSHSSYADEPGEANLEKIVSIFTGQAKYAARTGIWRWFLFFFWGLHVQNSALPGQLIPK
jgi:hypothetical protein